jgi:catechol-2,3-dioxygenase
MSKTAPRPRLTLGHSTLAARDLDRLSAFYCDVLGFQVTNRGPVGDDGAELAFLSQDPANHHQIAMVSGVPLPDPGFVMVDHLAFRTGTLDDLRTLRAGLQAAGVEGILPICHGNAWSLYFKDPEGNGIECFVDTPFHVAQPYGKGFDLDQNDDEVRQATREMIESDPEFQPMSEWREEFARKLERR